MNTEPQVVPGPKNQPNHGAGSRPLILGAVAILLAAVLGADERRPVPAGEMTGDLQMAIPVPHEARLVARSIDHEQGRSISVLDLDPATPPAWDDVVVVVRRRALPGVMVGYATDPVAMPPPSASIDDWRAFAASNEVRIDPHPDLRSALAAVVDRAP